MTPEAVQTSEAKRLKLRDAFRGLDVPNKDLDEAARFSLDPKGSKARMASQAWVHSNSAPGDEIPPSHLAQAFIGGAPATTATIQQPLEALVEVWDIERDRQSAIRFGTKGKVTDEQFYTSIAAQYNREDGVREDAVKTYQAATNAAILADFSEDEETGDVRYTSSTAAYETWRGERTWSESYPGVENDKLLRQVWKTQFEATSAETLETKKLGRALLTHLEIKEGVTDPDGVAVQAAPELYDKLRLMPKESRQQVYAYLQANVDTGKIEKGYAENMSKGYQGILARELGDITMSQIRQRAGMVRDASAGELRLLKPLEDDDEPADILMKTAVGGTGLITQTLFPTEELGKGDLKRILDAEKESMRDLEIEKELRDLRRGVINPLKSDNAFLEKSWYPAVEQVNTTAMAMSVVGLPALFAYTKEHRHQEMLERGMTEEQAGKASSVSAILETAIERLQVKTLVGGKYGLALKSVQGSILAKLGVVGGNLGAQITLQSAQEGIQDITPLIVQEYFGAALGEQFPEMQWLNKTNADGSVTKGELSKWGFQRIDTLWAMAPMIVFGAGVGSIKDFSNASKFLTTKDDLVAFGVTEEVASEISILAQTDVNAAGKVFQEAAKDIPAVKAFEEKSKQVEELRRSPDRLRATKLEDGKIEVQLGDGLTTIVNTEAEYVQLEQQVVEGRAKAARDGLANLFKYFEKKGIAEFIKEDRSKTLGEGIEDSTLTTEEARQRIRDYNAESGDSYSENAFSRFTIAAQNEAEFRDGVFHNLVRVFKGDKPMSIVEDVSEGHFKKLVTEGGRPQLETWLDQYQTATGDMLVSDTKTATDKSMVEAMSSLAVAHFTGKVQESSLPNGIKSLFRQLATYFQHVFSRAANLDKAFKEGKLDPEFETQLAESVGLSLDGREALAIQKAAVKEQKQVLKDLKSSMDETNKTNLNGLMDGSLGTTMSIQPANEDVRLGWHRSKEPESAVDARISHAWAAIGLSEEGFSFKKTPSKSAHDIAASVSTPGNTVIADADSFDRSAEDLRARRARNIANETDWAREQRLEWEKDNPGREFIFAEEWEKSLSLHLSLNQVGFSVKETGASIELFSTGNGKVNISATDASPNGKQLYTAANDFIHNNGLVDGNPRGLTKINRARKVSNMFASALRWGTVRHLSTNADMNVKFDSPLDDGFFRTNLAKLARAEAETVSRLAPGLRDIGLDFKSGAIINKEGVEATVADVENIVSIARTIRIGGRSPLGAATIVRSLITEAAANANVIPDSDLVNLPARLAKSDSLPKTFSITPLPEFEGATEISLRDEGFGFRNETDAKFGEDVTSLIRDNKEVTGPTSSSLLDLPQEGEGRGPAEMPAHMVSRVGVQEKDQVSQLLGVPLKDLEDTPVRRIGSISIPNDYKGVGMGQALRLSHYQEVEGGNAYFYNSQQSPEAARSTRALAAKGLIELHDRPSPGQVGLGANVTFLTEKGRKTEPLSLIHTRTAAEAKPGTTLSITPDLLEDVLDQHFNPPEARMDVVESIFDRLSKVQDRFIKIKRNAGTNKTLVTRAETQEVLAQLEAITAALPLPIRGKIQGFATLASKPTDRGRLTYLEGRIELSMKVLDKFLADESRKKFDKLLKRSQPRSANGKLKGYLTPEVAADLEDVQKLSAMTTEDLDAWSTGMQERVAKTGEAETATAKLWLAERFGAVKGMNAFEADAALTDLREMVAEGRNKHRLAEEAFKNQIADKLSQAFDDSVEDLNPNPDPEDVDRAKKAEKKGLLRVVRGIKGFLVDHLSFRQSLITVFGYSKTTDRMEKIANDAKNEFTDSTLARKQAMDDWMRVGLNLPSIKQRFQWLADLKEQKETGIVNTNNRKMKMSQDEAIYYTMLWDQPNYRSNLETHDGIDRRTIEKIEGWLTPESRQYRSWLQEGYDKEYDRINAVYRIINGVDLPKVTSYSPASTKLPGSKDLQLDPLGQDHLSTGLAAGFTKLRTAHNLPMRRTGASTMYWAHAQATDYYVSHALAARELRLIITNPKMMDAVVEKHGVHRAQVLEGWVTSLHNDGLKQASLVLSAERWTNRLVKTTSLVGLSWNTMTMAKQASAANAALAEVPVKDYAIGMNRILTSPEYYAYIWNSKTIQRRIANGFSPEMQQAMKRLEYRPDTLSMVMNQGVEAIGKVDAAWTTISAGIAYDYHYRLAKKANLSDAQAEAIALDKMDLVVARTAQPAALVDRSLMELNMDANILGRLFILFRSEMRQKAAITMMGVRDVIRNDGRALAGARAATSMWLVVPIVTALMEETYKTLMRDDEDEDLFDPKHLLHVMTAGQSAGIFFFGDAMEVASKRVWGEKIWSNDTNSVVSAVKQAFDALDKVTEGEFHEDLVANTNKVARAVSMVVGGRGAALGVGARVVNEAVRAVENISNGIEFFPTPSPTESALAELLAEQEEQDQMADEAEEILEEAKPQSLKDEEESLKEFKEEHKDLMKLRVGTLKKPGARARGVRAVLDAAPEEDRESLRQALIDAKIISNTVEKQLKKLKKLP